MNTSKHKDVLRATALISNKDKLIREEILVTKAQGNGKNTENEKLSECLFFQPLYWAEFKISFRLDYSKLVNGIPRLDANVFKLENGEWKDFTFTNYRDAHNTDKEWTDNKWVYRWKSSSKDLPEITIEVNLYAVPKAVGLYTQLELPK